MQIVGSKRSLNPLRNWRFVTKGSAISPSVPTAIGAGLNANCPSSGIAIPIKFQQAIWVRRYVCSLTQVVDDASLFLLGGQFQYQLTPFGLANAPIVYPAVGELSVASAGSTTGQVLSGLGVNFSLIGDWLEFDDIVGSPNTVPATNPGSMILQPAVQLQCQFKVHNIAAGGKTANVGESATWEIWENNWGAT